MSINAISARNNPVAKNIVLGFMNEQKSFVAGQILKPIKIEKNTGDIKTVGKDHLRIINDIQTDGDSVILTHSVTKAEKWDLERHSLKSLVTEDDMDQLGEQNAKNDFASFNAESLMVSRENGVSGQLTSTAVMTNSDTLTGGQQWDDYTNSDPQGDFRTAQASIRTACGRWGNLAVMGPKVWQDLTDHPDMKESGVNVGQANATMAKMKSIIFPGQPESSVTLLIGMAQYNSSKKGQTAVMADLWGRDFVLVYVNPNPNPRIHQSSLGYQFHRGQNSISVKEWMEADLDPAKWIKTTWMYDDVLLDVLCGYLFKAAVGA